MIKILQKDIQGVTVVIAMNDNKELKIGSLDDYNNLHMGAFVLGDDMWYGIGFDFIHTGVKNDEIFCNIGANLPQDNSEFPYELLSLDDIDIINTAIDFKY